MANRIGDYMEQEGIKFLKGYNIIKVISVCFRFFSLKKKEAKLQKEDPDYELSCDDEMTPLVITKRKSRNNPETPNEEDDYEVIFLPMPCVMIYTYLVISIRLY